MAARRRKRRPTAIGVAVIVGVCVLSVGALANYAARRPGNAVPLIEHNENPATAQPRTSESDSGPSLQIHRRPADAGSEAMVVKPKFNGDDLTFEHEKVRVPKGADPRKFAVEQFLSHAPVLPEGTRLLGVHVQGRVAVISFNERIRDGFGTDDGRVLLNGLREVMGQFPEVDSITLEANGEKLQELAEFDLSEPQAVIRPAH